MKLKPRVQRFEQVKTALTNSILSGKFNPGDRLPSLRDLCAYFHFSLATIQRAVHELKEQEWLVSLPQKGIMVSNPLPPMAHLMRLKKNRRADGAKTHASIVPAQNGITLKCQIFDEALLPLFDWSAREYSKDYAPCSLRFDVQPLPGRDDIDAMRNLDADLMLIPSYTISYGANLDAITPADNILINNTEDVFSGIPPGIVNLVSFRGKRWGMPVMMDGPILVASEKKCRQFDIGWQRLTDMDSVLTSLEEASKSAGGKEIGAMLFNLAFPSVLLMSSGHDFPGISHMLKMLSREDVRLFYERLRALAQNPLIAMNRFDQWDRADLTKVAIRHQSSGLFCRDPKDREDAHVLPIPGQGAGRISMSAICMCVSARSVHVYEAWEWAARLGGAPFQARLAEMAYNIPVSLDQEVCRAFEKAIGVENARTLQDLIRRPSCMHGIWDEDARRYHWEIYGNELYRFIAGVNDYDRMMKRLKTKTERFIPCSKFSSSIQKWKK